MSDRRSFVIGVGSALLGSASSSHAAAAVNADEGIYAVGLLWRADLAGPLGQLRLNVYLAVGENGIGTGVLNDAVDPNVNSHITILSTVGDERVTEFHGEIARSNTPALAGQPFVIRSAINADGGTVLVLEVGGAIFWGFGRVFRITNVRGNASQFAGSAGSFQGQIPIPAR